MTDADCESNGTGKNYCVGNQCVECRDSSGVQCSLEEAPICDSTEHNCRVCEKDEECKEKDNLKPFCDIETGRCAASLGCQSSEDCASGVCIDTVCQECDDSHQCENGYVCEKAGENKNKCVLCDENHICADGLHCNDLGRCVSCISDEQCTLEAPVCLLTGEHAYTCAACITDSDCTDTSKSFCVTAGVEANRCVECLKSEHCEDGKVCDASSHTCTSCDTTEHLCALPLTCDEESGICVECVMDNDCEIGFCINHQCIECDGDIDCTDSVKGKVCSEYYKCELCSEETNCKTGKCDADGFCHKICSKGILCGNNIDDESCCTGTEKCLYGKCVMPGEQCTVDEDCAIWDKCDAETKTCIALETDPEECIYMPEIPDFNSEQAWEYILPKEVNSFDSGVVGLPVVVNLTDDNHDGKIDENDIPEVVFVTVDFVLNVVSGDTGKVLAQSTDLPYNYSTDIAAADIDNDGKVELLIPSSTDDAEKTGLYSYNLTEENGKYVLKQKNFIKATIFNKSNPGNYSSRYVATLSPTIADIDSDGIPDIVTTQGIIGNNDWSKWKCQLNLPGSEWYYDMFAVADLDQDGNMEIIDRNIYNNNCEIIADKVEDNWRYSAVADMLPDENDPNYPGELTPEIVRTTSNGFVSVWKVYKNNGKWTQRKIWQSNQISSGGGGNPNIADFNGDGKPEIGIAGRFYYNVFNGQTGAVIWKRATSDPSGSTGSSVFDFEADGKAEVVYRDENKLRVYNGSDGKVLWETDCKSNTVIEYPLIVDVNNDGHAEIISGCRKASTNGLTVFRDVYNRWVPTRRIWNQHSYHITNINEDGSVPQHESANWLNKRFNNYRQNVLGEGIYNAPNMIPGFLAENKEFCTDNPSRLGLQATISNNGKLDVSGAIMVSFYINDYFYEDKLVKLYLGTAEASGLNIGEQKTVIFHWDMKTAYLVEDGKVTSTKVELTSIRGLRTTFTVDDAANTGKPQYMECSEEDNELKESRTIILTGC